MGKVLKWGVYVLSVTLVTVLSMTVTMSTSSAMTVGLWFGVVPIACIIFISSTHTEVRFKWNLLVEDLRWSLKYLAGFLAYNVVLCAIIVPLSTEISPEPRIHLSFVFSNVVEELLFRATLIPAFEALERSLFGSVNRTRVIGVTAIEFGLWHLPRVLTASIPLVRYIAIENVVFACVAGVFFGITFLRSRNLPSTILLHWWFNFQNQVVTLVTFRLLT